MSDACCGTYYPPPLTRRRRTTSSDYELSFDLNEKVSNLSSPALSRRKTCSGLDYAAEVHTSSPKSRLAKGYTARPVAGPATPPALSRRRPDGAHLLEIVKVMSRSEAEDPPTFFPDRQLLAPVCISKQHSYGYDIFPGLPSGSPRSVLTESDHHGEHPHSANSPPQPSTPDAMEAFSALADSAGSSLSWSSSASRPEANPTRFRRAKTMPSTRAPPAKSHVAIRKLVSPEVESPDCKWPSSTPVSPAMKNSISPTSLGLRETRRNSFGASSFIMSASEIASQITNSHDVRSCAELVKQIVICEEGRHTDVAPWTCSPSQRSFSRLLP